MKPWTEILDHGDDPGRYTVIEGNGQVATYNENGRRIFSRKCHNPYTLLYGLRRQDNVGIVPPKKVKALLEKFNTVNQSQQ